MVKQWPMFKKITKTLVKQQANTIGYVIQKINTPPPPPNPIKSVNKEKWMRVKGKLRSKVNQL